MKTISSVKRSTLFVAVLLFMGASLPGFSQEGADDIAQDLQNPLAKMTLLPIQHNFSLGAGENGKMAYGISFQPLLPMGFKDFNLVNRIVFGAGYLPGVSGEMDFNPGSDGLDGQSHGTWGTTDLNYSVFYAPKMVNKLAWGIGPSINFPTASDKRLGTGKWSAGGSLVFVYQTNKWTFDVVLRQTWSFAGDESRNDVNQFVGQPLIAYNLGKGWVANTFPTITANWTAENGQKLTIPVGGGISKVLFLGKLPVSAGLQYYRNVVKPDMAPASEFRISTVFVFSK